MGTDSNPTLLDVRGEICPYPMSRTNKELDNSEKPYFKDAFELLYNNKAIISHYYGNIYQVFNMDNFFLLVSFQ